MPNERLRRGIEPQDPVATARFVRNDVHGGRHDPERFGPEQEIARRRSCDQLADRVELRRSVAVSRDPFDRRAHPVTGRRGGASLDRGAECPQGVVVVRDRHAEHRHELLGEELPE